MAPSVRNTSSFRGSAKAPGSTILVTPINSSFTARNSGGSMSRGNSSLSRSSFGSLNRTSSPRSNSFGGGFGNSSNKSANPPFSSDSSSLKPSNLVSSVQNEKENVGSRGPRPSNALFGPQLANQLEKVFQRLTTLEEQYKTTKEELDHAKNQIQQLGLSNSELKKSNESLKYTLNKETERREQNESVIIEQILDLEDVVSKHFKNQADQGKAVKMLNVKVERLEMYIPSLIASSSPSQSCLLEASSESPASEGDVAEEDPVQTTFRSLLDNTADDWLVDLMESSSELVNDGRDELLCSPSPAPTRNNSLEDVTDESQVSSEMKATKAETNVPESVTARESATAVLEPSEEATTPIDNNTEIRSKEKETEKTDLLPEEESEKEVSVLPKKETPHMDLSQTSAQSKTIDQVVFDEDDEEDDENDGDDDDEIVFGGLVAPELSTGEYLESENLRGPTRSPKASKTQSKSSSFMSHLLSSAGKSRTPPASSEPSIKNPHSDATSPCTSSTPERLETSLRDTLDECPNTVTSPALREYQPLDGHQVLTPPSRVMHSDSTKDKTSYTSCEVTPTHNVLLRTQSTGSTTTPTTVVNGLENLQRNLPSTSRVRSTSPAHRYHHSQLPTTTPRSSSLSQSQAQGKVTVDMLMQLQLQLTATLAATACSPQQNTHPDTAYKSSSQTQQTRPFSSNGQSPSTFSPSDSISSMSLSLSSSPMSPFQYHYQPSPSYQSRHISSMNQQQSSDQASSDDKHVSKQQASESTSSEKRNNLLLESFKQEAAYDWRKTLASRQDHVRSGADLLEKSPRTKAILTQKARSPRAPPPQIDV